MDLNLLGGRLGAFKELDKEEQIDVLAYRRILLDPEDATRTILLHPLAVNNAHASIQGVAWQDDGTRRRRAPRPIPAEMQPAISHMVRAGNNPTAVKMLLGVA